jgi:hypothetical protein
LNIKKEVRASFEGIRIERNQRMEYRQIERRERKEDKKRREEETVLI